MRIKTSDLTDEEQQLVLAGELQFPEKEMSKVFLDRMLSLDLPLVQKGSAVAAVIADRDE
jgi:hypothetical protein